MEELRINSIDDLPDLNGNRYPERVTVCVSRDTKAKIDLLKSRGKDVRKIMRNLLTNFLEQINFEDAS